MMLKNPKKSWGTWRKKTCFRIMEYGTSKKKTVCRRVYTEKTLSPNYPLYWFEMYPNAWRNTSKVGVTTGVVATKTEFNKARKWLK